VFAVRTTAFDDARERVVTRVALVCGNRKVAKKICKRFSAEDGKDLCHKRQLAVVVGSQVSEKIYPPRSLGGYAAAIQ
jgi:hypothetical protein